jgi:hypothetical protein
MVEVASDWNYANTGIYGESAFILYSVDARKFLGVFLPLLQRCALPAAIAHDQLVRGTGREREKIA